MPSLMVMVVVMVDASTVHMSSGSGHSDSCDCNSRESGDEFDLVHGVVPFFFWSYVFRLDSRADKSADKSANERCSDLAPILRVERAVVVVMIVVLRLVVHRMRCGRIGVMCNLVSRHCLHLVGLAFCRCLCGLLCGRRCFRQMLLGGLCFRSNRSVASGTASALRSGIGGSADSGAHGQRQRQHLECLVHCRVPFVFAQAHSRAYTELGADA